MGARARARVHAHGEELREETLRGCSVKLTRRQGYVNRRSVVRRVRVGSWARAHMHVCTYMYAHVWVELACVGVH